MKYYFETIAVFSLFAALGCGGDETPKGNNQSSGSNNGTISGTTGTTGNPNNTNGNNGTTGTIGNNGTVANNGVTNGTTGTNGPTIAEIFDGAFMQTGCTAGYCHGGAVDGLVIANAEMALENMVDVDSIRPECGLTKLVVPGDPEASLLWLRVRPAALETGEPCANKMPKGSDGLDEATAQLIYDWIAGGAQ